MYVRPHLDYCDVIYHVPPSTNPFDSSLNLTVHMEHIERVQYQAALAITGCWQGSNRNKLYEELSWESLSDRRWFRRLVHFYKFFCNNSPPYLYEHIPQLRIPIYGQRRPKTLHEIKCRTAKYTNSFFPNCVKAWNNMCDEIRNSDSLMIFKTKLFSLIRPPKKSIFDIHKPTEIKHIFRLRLGLSELKSHKKRHNFLDTPNDICSCNQASADTFHYLLRCGLFAPQRDRLLTYVQIILNKYNLVNLLDNVDVFLYGHRNISIDDNKNILLATMKFINETGRFL